MSILNTITVPTINDGAVLVRLESRVPNPRYEGVRDAEVWSAEGTDVRGRKQRGFGGDPVEAVVDVLQTLEIVRQERPEVTVTEQPPLLDRLFGPGSSEKAGFQVGEGFRPLSSFDKSLDTPVYQDLPDEFWEAIREDKKILAIKELRTATGLSLKSSKALVDYIIPSGKTAFRAAGAAPGTVIRVRGSFEPNSQMYAGWVFERSAFGDGWDVTGVEDDYDHEDVQYAMDRYGFDILYTPPKPPSRRELHRTRMEIEADQAEEG